MTSLMEHRNDRNAEVTESDMSEMSETSGIVVEHRGYRIRRSNKREGIIMECMGCGVYVSKWKWCVSPLCMT
jgi:hypothetical protein